MLYGTIDLYVHIQHFRYWAEKGEEHFPRHKSVMALKSELGMVGDGDGNGNGHANGRGSVDTSPEAGGGADDSVLWSASFNGSRRNPIQRLDTPDRYATNKIYFS